MGRGYIFGHGCRAKEHIFLNGDNENEKGNLGQFGFGGGGLYGRL